MTHQTPPWAADCVSADLMAPYGQLPEKAWKDIDWKALEHRIDIDGISTNYVDVGTGGPPVVLVHGIGTSYQTWLCTIPTIAEHRRVIAMDLPGFGSSARPDTHFDARDAATHIDRLCESLGLGMVDLIGHSMGAFLTLKVASQYPERVRSLAVVSGSLSTVAGFYASPLTTLLHRPVICSRFILLITLAALPIPQSIVRFVIESRRLRTVLCSLYADRPGALDPESLYSAMSSGGRPATIPAAIAGFSYQFADLAPSMKTLFGRPILVIAGETDSLAGTSDADDFCDSIGIAELVILPKTGHWPMVERPQTFNCLLLSWLERQS